MKRIFIFSIILLILLLSLIVRVVVYENSRLPGFNPFTNICAFHYYVTKAIVKDGCLPVVLKELQYPEGIEIFKKTSVFMEYVIGYGYRLFGKNSNIDLDAFIRHFVRLFGILPVIIVYFVSKTLTKNRVAGVVSAAAYGLSPVSIARTMGFGFLRENFTLPFIFLHILFFIRALSDDGGERRSNYCNAWLSAVFFTIALASWHFTQFYFIIFVTFSLIAGILYRDRRLLKILLITDGFAIAASLFVPYLKELNFITSFPMIYSYLVIITLFIGQRAGEKLYARVTLFAFPFAALSLFFVLSFFKKDISVYGHVYNLFFYSIKFLGQKPADPALLPEHARLLWDVSHRSPGWRMLLFYFGPALAVSAVPVYKNCVYAIRGKIATSKIALLYFLFVFFTLYLFVNRLMVFAIFFISIGIGLWYSLIAKSKRRYLVTAILSIFLCMEFARVLFMATDVRQTAHTANLLGWIEENTSRGDVILAPPRCSPEILAYTGRPIVLHAKLETKEIRDKTLAWADSLFSYDEEKLFSLCKRWGAEYFVFAKGTYTNTGGSSWRYITDNMAFDRRAVGYRMEIVPADSDFSRFEYSGAEYKVAMSAGYPKPQFRHFLLVFQNALFNVYKVIE